MFDLSLGWPDPDIWKVIKKKTYYIKSYNGNTFFKSGKFKLNRKWNYEYDSAQNPNLLNNSKPLPCVFVHVDRTPSAVTPTTSDQFPYLVRYKAYLTYCDL